MFLHIGENTSVHKDDIIAILDKKTIDKSKETRLFIDGMTRKNKPANEDHIKTYIIAADSGEKEYGLYTSSISSITLLNRR